ncbi:MAG TPA: methyltransferase domain-containing protein [Amnibacterium sp.]
MGTATDLSPDQLPSGWTEGAGEYDTWFAPVTRRFAADAVGLLGLEPGSRFLDVAAGTGALALAAAATGASVVATDFAPGMVALLAERFAEAGVDGSVARMDGQALDLPDASFDAAGSLFGLIFFPDMAAGVRELLRVVHPGGRVLVGAWHRSGFSLPFAVMRALRTAVPGLRPPQEEPVPFRLGDRAGMEALLTEAGLRDVRVEVATHVAEVADPAAMFRAVPLWAAPLKPVFDALSPDQLDRAAFAFAEQITAGGDPVGRLPGTALLGVGAR